METAKLTLRPSRDVIFLARKMSEESKTSITQLFSSFILACSQKDKTLKRVPLGPLTREISGILKRPKNRDYKKEMADILDERYERRS